MAADEPIDDINSETAATPIASFAQSQAPFELFNNFIFEEPLESIA